MFLERAFYVAESHFEREEVTTTSAGQPSIREFDSCAYADTSYFLEANHKQVVLAARATDPIVRRTHLELAELYREKARASLAAAMGYSVSF